jgi:SAM-dependent methyltransferase
VPRLTPTDAALAVDAAAEATAQRFGVEWHLFDHRAAYHDQQFRDWIAPLVPSEFSDAVVLEGGCGKGRHTALVAGWGARAVVALDLGSAVDVAFAATRHLPAAHVVQGDVTRPPVQASFDIAFSVGVLHHLPEPRAGFDALVGRVKPGGRIAIWVYGREGNEWIVRLVDPVRRRVTSRLPERTLYWATILPAAAIRAALPLYRPRALAAKLPYGSYLHYISDFPLREVHHILFDQLVTPIAHYLPEAEVRRWFERADLAGAMIARHNANSWRGSARVSPR